MGKTTRALIIIGIVLFSTLAAIHGHNQKDVAWVERDLYKQRYEDMEKLYIHCITPYYNQPKLLTNK